MSHPNPEYDPEAHYCNTPDQECPTCTYCGEYICAVDPNEPRTIEQATQIHNPRTLRTEWACLPCMNEGDSAA